MDHASRPAPLVDRISSSTAQAGQLFLVQFEGIELNERVQGLIQDFNVGGFWLTRRNLRSVSQATQLIFTLQACAQQAGHTAPLLIAIEQEGGGLDSLVDERISQFPNAAAIGAHSSLDTARQIARATAQELQCCGFNFMLGPVLGIQQGVKDISFTRYFGTAQDEVLTYCGQFVKGYHDAGLIACGKDWNLWSSDRTTKAADIGARYEDWLSMESKVKDGLRCIMEIDLDAMIVPHDQMPWNVFEKYPTVSSVYGSVSSLRDLGFEGVIVEDHCQSTQSINQLDQTHMSLFASGADMVILPYEEIASVCNLHELFAQLHVSDLSQSTSQKSLDRVSDLKARCLSWEVALNPTGLDGLKYGCIQRMEVAEQVLRQSVVLARDTKNFMSALRNLDPGEPILILSPHVHALPASDEYKKLLQQLEDDDDDATIHSRLDKFVETADNTFRSFGQNIARRRKGKVIQAPYTMDGLRPTHQMLIHRAKAVVVLTANSHSNKYQHAFVKHVSMLCQYSVDENARLYEKPCIIVAVSSPADFLLDDSVSTYLYSYTFLEWAMRPLAQLIIPDHNVPSTPHMTPVSTPGGMNTNTNKEWMIEPYIIMRDQADLVELLSDVRVSTDLMFKLLSNVTPGIFVLPFEDVQSLLLVARARVTGELIGFMATYYWLHDHTADIGAIMVKPGLRGRGIGTALHDQTLTALREIQAFMTLKLGARMPNVFPGIPDTDASLVRRLRKWFSALGWDMSNMHIISKLQLFQLGQWTPPEGLGRSLEVANVKYDIVLEESQIKSVLSLVCTCAAPVLNLMYRRAISNMDHCTIIRAKRANEDTTVACTLIYRSERLADFNPHMRNAGSTTACIGGIVIAADQSSKTSLLQGLILLGVRQMKKLGMTTVRLDYLDMASAIPGLEKMGFQLLDTFLQVQGDLSQFH